MTDDVVAGGRGAGEGPGRVLVMGAGGFVGRRLTAAFREAGWEVVAATRAGGADGPALDVTDADAVRRRVAEVRPRVVVNLAAIAHRKLEGSAADVYEAVNHRGVRHLLDASLAAGVERFVHFSSASVYGEEGRSGALREDAERRPVGPYAESKARAEDACAGVDPARMPVVVLRPPAIWAPGWVRDVRKRAYVPGTGVLLEITGRPPHHSLCALEHVVGFARMAAEGVAPGVYNVADDPPYAQPEIAAAIGALEGTRRRVRVPAAAAGLPLAVARLVPGGAGRVIRSHAWKLLRGLVLDTARARAAGFVPRYRLDDLLRDGDVA
ncbi:MAG TPA: NAD(P)-dependent oxidoreductase [Longimicrobium sp.]|nr:NAD(P)-dependent oxidoreductase [Longimicrobium sp.]